MSYFDDFIDPPLSSPIPYKLPRIHMFHTGHVVCEGQGTDTLPEQRKTEQFHKVTCKACLRWLRENFDSWSSNLTSDQIERSIWPAIYQQLERKFGERNAAKFNISVTIHMAERPRVFGRLKRGPKLLANAHEIAHSLVVFGNHRRASESCGMSFSNFKHHVRRLGLSDLRVLHVSERELAWKLAFRNSVSFEEAGRKMGVSRQRAHTKFTQLKKLNAKRKAILTRA